MLGVAGVFGGSLFSAMHGSLVTSSLIRETTENESANEGYKFGQEEETYNIENQDCVPKLQCRILETIFEKKLSEMQKIQKEEKFLETYKIHKFIVFC